MPSGAGERLLWDDRIARARRLASEHPDAADLLTFYASLAEYQASLLKKGSGVLPAPTTTGEKDSRLLFRERLDIDFILSAIPDFLAWLQQNAPANLAASTNQLRVADGTQREIVLERYLDGDDDESGESLDAFVVEVVLQPFAEQLAKSESTRGSRLGSLRTRCFCCGGAPVLGVLRDEGHGVKRSLRCGLCLTEYDYLRVVCPACDEQRFDALPIYTADRFGHVRIEACDSCRTYLKTIDLTRDGTAIPVVDDLASVSLDLWARDRGYQRLRPNLLRV
ncbi:MAG: formate dehydrogenase accessory protein FdhE [Acidobacteria bacterium]|nr:MAG: formate dehydrogenase accessory protein FdhE [Acidobacteriota bacterium]